MYENAKLPFSLYMTFDNFLKYIILLGIPYKLPYTKITRKALLLYTVPSAITLSHNYWRLLVE